MFRKLSHVLIGKPLHNRELANERMANWKALPIFSSDALSSVAYGPEQIMLILAVPGILAYGFIAPVAIAILILLAIITFSYIQVTRANPGGGGSYAVAKTHLGETPSLVAASALFTDYVLTVAVSVSSGTAAIVSAFPLLLPYQVSIDLFVLFALLMIINLRGTRESSTAFVFPTYAFILGILLLIGVGLFQALTGTTPTIPAESLEKQWSLSMLYLALRAFSNGCSSMTGVEAISNGVPMFKKPEVDNATKTTYHMAILLAIMFAGITFLIMHYHILPIEGVTALSQIAEKALGRNFLYYYVQFTTMMVLYLAANTSFSGLPPLLSILAKDGFMPRYLANRGNRLNFSNGIVLLSITAGILIVAYQGDTENLISLYAVGVFLSFTIAQSGMVIHWFKEKSPHWMTHAFVNGFGALITGIVVLIIMITKFVHGAWMVLVFIPIMVWIFKKIHHHYQDVSNELSLSLDEMERILEKPAGKNWVIVPIATPTRVVAEALKYARTISNHVIALNIAIDNEKAQRVQEKWNTLDLNVDLIIVNSPYRQVVAPLLDYVETIRKQKAPEDYITILIPEFETKKWWHRLLHNQTGWVLGTLLVLKDDIIVTRVPYHLRK